MHRVQRMAGLLPAQPFLEVENPVLQSRDLFVAARDHAPEDGIDRGTRKVGRAEIGNWHMHVIRVVM
ncbi:hypothetical protein Apmu_0266_06 [Acidiphilium multivorum AIU301]|nr:hypothetical protein Apmu_0266_06 [Acidiphilium multivorum AIU301]